MGPIDSTQPSPTVIPRPPMLVKGHVFHLRGDEGHESPHTTLECLVTYMRWNGLHSLFSTFFDVKDVCIYSHSSMVCLARMVCDMASFAHVVTQNHECLRQTEQVDLCVKV